MSDDSTAGVGSITWFDLTVPDADSLKDFYAEVVGWKIEPVAMQGYHDYGMSRPADGTMVAGVCHARGPNVGMPPVWLAYVTVQDLSASVQRCRELGGTCVCEPRELGGGRIAVIQDPTGAMIGLHEPARPEG